MTSSFFYVLSSALRLELEQVPSLAELQETQALLERQVSGILRPIWARQELINILSHWSESAPKPKREALPALLSSEERERLSKEAELWPEFASDWWSENSLDWQKVSRQQRESELWDALYTYYGGHHHPLIRDYYALEHQLQQYQAVYQATRFDFISIDLDTIELAPDLMQGIKRGLKALSEQQKAEYPHLASILEALDSNNPLKIFEARKESLWRFCEERSHGHYFDEVALICYGIRFALSYRHRQLLNSQKSESMETLVELIHPKKVAS